MRKFLNILAVIAAVGSLTGSALAENYPWQAATVSVEVRYEPGKTDTYTGLPWRPGMNPIDATKLPLKLRLTAQWHGRFQDWMIIEINGVANQGAGKPNWLYARARLQRPQSQRCPRLWGLRGERSRVRRILRRKIRPLENDPLPAPNLINKIKNAADRTHSNLRIKWCACEVDKQDAVGCTQTGGFQSFRNGVHIGLFVTNQDGKFQRTRALDFLKERIVKVLYGRNRHDQRIAILCKAKKFPRSFPA